MPIDDAALTSHRKNFIRLTSTKPNCHLPLAKGGGSNTSVALQMAKLLRFVK